MSKYITKQRKALISFLSNHTDEQLSANQIADGLKNDNISLSAVYRNLIELEAEGKVRRCANNKLREVLYQYIDADCCKNCLHLSCKMCGKTYHMDNRGANQLIKNVALSEMFEIDKSDTVLYGICKLCKNRCEGNI